MSGARWPERPRPFTAISPGGLAAGMGAGAVLAALFGVLAVYRGADQVVVGTGLNILALGLTEYFFRALQGREWGHSRRPRSLPRRFRVEPAAGVGEALFHRNCSSISPCCWCRWRVT